jgi:FMN phosphatase YigB (HAD superfamily)
MPILVSAGLPAAALKTIRAVIFDFDGTLYDYRLLPWRIIGVNPLELFLVWNERRTRKAFSGRDLGSPEKFYEAYYSHLGKLSRRRPKVIEDWYIRRYIPRLIHVLKRYYAFRPGVEEIFTRLESKISAAGRLKGVAVYSDYPALRERFNALGFNPGSGIRLYGPESFGAQKPAPRPFRVIAEEMGASPEETLVIGDREDTDGKGALNAGMNFFRLDDGRRRYFRLDPDRKPPGRREKEESLSPSPAGYGSWETICAMLSVFWD